MHHNFQKRVQNKARKQYYILLLLFLLLLTVIYAHCALKLVLFIHPRIFSKISFFSISNNKYFMNSQNSSGAKIKYLLLYVISQNNNFIIQHNNVVFPVRMYKFISQNCFKEKPFTNESGIAFYSVNLVYNLHCFILR